MTTSLKMQLLKELPFKTDTSNQDITIQGIKALINCITKDKKQGNKQDHNNIDNLTIDKFILQIDGLITQQMDVILHNAIFQKAEAVWRSIYYLVQQTDFRENIKIDLLNANKQDLKLDFDTATELNKSGLYRLIYSREYGQLGGEPYAAIISDLEFAPSSGDLKLLTQLSNVAANAHAPLIANANANFFGLDSYLNFSELKDIKAIFASQIYTKWHSLRQAENSRYIGLCLPHFLLRTPYHPEENPCQEFIYYENAQQHNDYLWGAAAFAFATRLSSSFANFRWCPNIIGPNSGGAIKDLPMHYYQAMGKLESKIPTETMLSDRREYELAEEGFIPLTFRKGSDEAVFFSANSIQKPKYFGIASQAKTAEMNFKLGTQLPYMFIICRIAHYLKVLQREGIGSWKEASDLEIELNSWLSQYIANQENAPAYIRSKKPLRDANIKVTSIEGEPGWYKANISIRPHFKYMGANITLSLSSRIEQIE